VFEISITDISVKHGTFIFPHDIDEAPRRKLPGINGIYIENIEVLVLYWYFGMRCRNQIPVLLKIIYLFHMYLAPVMPGAKRDPGFVVQTVLNGKDVFNCLQVTA